ncbi:MAG: nicotinate-nucleotide adenylyltransferase [Selenomonadaceae bacterium]|nr:nicotinate-nucleotide adenylyltransferase [Selenomonadaceae bacterium]
MAVKKRIGIFGGTFDPIHLGHLIVAETIMDEFSLDRVVFIPAAVPPHKLGQDVSEARHRYMMTMLAICSNPRFEASDMEMQRSGPSYSRDTLAELIREHGEDTEFYFVVGADSVASLHTWNRIEELLAMCHFVGASRPGCLPDMEDIRRRFGRLADRIHCLETPELEISSTDIRQRVRQGKTIRYIVPEAVEQYIYKERLYL